MGQSGQAAILAVTCVASKNIAPADAWDFAISKLSDSHSVRAKCCPRGAFLSLCESGAVIGVPAGAYGAPRGGKNGQYAKNALGILRSKPSLASDKNTLWAMATAAEVLAHNQQMDVVLSLWQKQLLR